MTVDTYISTPGAPYSHVSNSNQYDASITMMADMERGDVCDAEVGLVDIQNDALYLPLTGVAPQSKRIKTCSYKEAPQYLKGNPYITAGYMSMLPLHLCIRSLFVWSNETLNTWSHLLAFFVFLFYFAYDNAVWLPRHDSSLYDHLFMSLGLLCFQFTMLCSTGYHLFRAHSELTHRRWLALDFTGIAVGLLGLYLPGIYLAFYCMQVWCGVYLLVISLLFACVFLCLTQPHHYTDVWFRVRVSVYCGVALYGILPSLHWVYLSDGFSSPVVQMFGHKILIMYVLGAMAFSCYIFKFPESICPGRFNFIGSSHQLWHVIVVIAFLYWHNAGRSLLEYRLEGSCPL